MQLLMGNEAIAMGAIQAGVNLVAGYPGTPSTEILETVAKENDGSIYVEWSVNEKAALEVAAGASYAGARTLVTMKQVGLNVASDALMSLAYVGCVGGMVIVAADDPGPISSQTEQDTRTFASFAKIPVFDPASPEEAFEMVQDAFAISEIYNTPVLLRPTTRVCHGCASMEIDAAGKYRNVPKGFVKDTGRFVIFPRTSYLNHKKIEERNPQIGDLFSEYMGNKHKVYGDAKKPKRLGIATGGISYAYTREAIIMDGYGKRDFSLLKVGTPFPFPAKLALEFLQQVDEVLCMEELDPVIEKELLLLCGQHHLPVRIHGKLDKTAPCAGENSVELARCLLADFFDKKVVEELCVNTGTGADRPALPVRPPVLCAGCPHRASFYAVKQAVKGRNAVFSGDIGCYTLGNAKPLDMVDTCLCMGADVTIAQGLQRVEPDTLHFAFIGDSTFFASGMTGVVNAVYNQTDIILVVLDNSTTAMTGHQPHPGTGKTMMGGISEKVSIEKVLLAMGVSYVTTVNPFHRKEALRAVEEAAACDGVRAVIFQAPCIAVTKPAAGFSVNQDKCIQCKKCIRDLGCPAIVVEDGRVMIEPSLCYGCTLCAQVCPAKAIEGVGKERGACDK